MSETPRSRKGLPFFSCSETSPPPGGRHGFPHCRQILRRGQYGPYLLLFPVDQRAEPAVIDAAPGLGNGKGILDCCRAVCARPGDRERYPTRRYRSVKATAQKAKNTAARRWMPLLYGHSRAKALPEKCFLMIHRLSETIRTSIRISPPF